MVSHLYVREKYSLHYAATSRRLGFQNDRLISSCNSGVKASDRTRADATALALQTTVADLSARVAEPATQISDLRLAVAGQTVASPVAMSELQTLSITISFRADQEDVQSTGLGEERSGQGRFRNVGEDADFGIYMLDEELPAAPDWTGPKLTPECQIFDECTMPFVLAHIPYHPVYLIGISDHSVLMRTYADFEQIGRNRALNYR